MDETIPTETETVTPDTETTVETPTVEEEAPETIDAPAGEPVLDTYHTTEGAEVEDAYLVQ